MHTLTHSLKNTTLAALPKSALNRPTDSESLLHFLPDLSSYVLKVCDGWIHKNATHCLFRVVVHKSIGRGQMAKDVFDWRTRQENQNLYSKNERKNNWPPLHSQPPPPQKKALKAFKLTEERKGLKNNAIEFHPTCFSLSSLSIFFSRFFLCWGVSLLSSTFLPPDGVCFPSFSLVLPSRKWKRGRETREGTN